MWGPQRSERLSCVASVGKATRVSPLPLGLMGGNWATVPDTSHRDVCPDAVWALACEQFPDAQASEGKSPTRNESRGDPVSGSRDMRGCGRPESGCSSGTKLLCGPSGPVVCKTGEQWYQGPLQLWGAVNSRGVPLTLSAVVCGENREKSRQGLCEEHPGDAGVALVGQAPGFGQLGAAPNCGGASLREGHSAFSGGWEINGYFLSQTPAAFFQKYWRLICMAFASI